MQTNQENVNTSSGVPVQMVSPQLSVQAQTQNMNSQNSSPYSTMMYPAMSMAQSPLQHQMQAMQQNMSTNSEAPVQVVLPELSAQDQSVQNVNNTQSSSSHPTLMHSTMTISQPQLQNVQNQMQTLHQNINTDSGAPLQMVLPEMNTQAQTVQGGNNPQSSSSQHTMYIPTMTVTQPGLQNLQNIQVIQQPLSSFFQPLYSPQQFFLPSNMTYQQHPGGTPTVQSINPTQNMQLQSKLPVMDPKNSFNGHTFQVISPVTKGFSNQTLLSKPIYSSTLPLHSSQTQNGNQIKQLTSNQVFGSFSTLPQGITLTPQGNFQASSFLSPNSIIHTQQPELILQSSPQTAVFLPVSGGTNSSPNTIYAIVPQKKCVQRQIRYRHPSAVGNQMGTVAYSEAEKNKVPIPRFHTMNIKPKTQPKVAVMPYSSLVTQSTPMAQTTVETQTNQNQPQLPTVPALNSQTANITAINSQVTNVAGLNSQITNIPGVNSQVTNIFGVNSQAASTPGVNSQAPSAPGINSQAANIPGPNSHATSSPLVPIVPVTPQLESLTTKNNLPVPEIEQSTPVTVSCNMQAVDSSFTDMPAATLPTPAVTITTTSCTSPIVTSVLNTHTTSIPVITSTAPSEMTPPLTNLLNAVQALDPIVIKKEPVECSPDCNVENPLNKPQTDLGGITENESTNVQTDCEKITENEVVEHQANSNMVVEDESVKNQTDSKIVEMESINYKSDSRDVEHEPIEVGTDSTNNKHTGPLIINTAETLNISTEFQADPKEVNGSERELSGNLIDTSKANENELSEHYPNEANESKPVEHQTVSLGANESDFVTCKVDSNEVSKNELVKNELNSRVMEPISFPDISITKTPTAPVEKTSDAPVEKTRLKAVVRPHILTHVIDGFVIYESSEPFPVTRSALMSDPPSEKIKQDDKTKESEQETLDKPKKAEQRKSDRRKSVEPKKLDHKKSELKKTDPKKLDEPKTDQRMPDEPKFTEQKSSSESKKIGPNDPKKPGDFWVSPEVKVPKIPGKRGRKRKVLTSISKEENESPPITSSTTAITNPSMVTSPSITVTNPIITVASQSIAVTSPSVTVSNNNTPSVKVIDVVDLEVEPASKENRKDVNIPVPATLPVDTPHVEKAKEIQPEADFTQKLPTSWSVQDVYKFVKDIPSCADYAEEFRTQEIDGKALLLLKVDHIVTFTNMKFGPAIKLISLINSMKEKFSLEV